MPLPCPSQARFWNAAEVGREHVARCQEQTHHSVRVSIFILISILSRKNIGLDVQARSKDVSNTLLDCNPSKTSKPLEYVDPIVDMNILSSHWDERRVWNIGYVTRSFFVGFIIGMIVHEPNTHI